MEIAAVESFPIEIPLESPVSFSNRTLTFRDHAVTRVRTESGLEGVGYSLGYETAPLIADAVESRLAPVVEGEDPRDTARLWEEMYEGNVQVGRHGLFLRAISTVDMALWDITAKAAGQPLHKLLGGYAESVPSYASGGYYRDDKGHEGLRAEVSRYLDEGHDTVKMKVGRRSVDEEVDRVAAVRDEIGDDRTLLLDANGVWSSTTEAVRACRAFEPYDPYFIEEPVMIDRVETMAEVNDALSYPVATGELEDAPQLRPAPRHRGGDRPPAGRHRLWRDHGVAPHRQPRRRLRRPHRAPLQLEHPHVAVGCDRERPVHRVLLPGRGREGVRRRGRRPGRTRR